MPILISCVITYCKCTAGRQARLLLPARILTVFILSVLVAARLSAEEASPSSSSLSSSTTSSFASPVSEQTQSPVALEGKRLFFAADERLPKASTAKSDVTASSILTDKSKRLNESARESSLHSNQPEKLPVQERMMSDSIRYMARVQGRRSLQFIINGVACQPVKRQMLTDSLSGLKLDCNGLEALRTELTIEKDGRTLQITQGNSVLATLRPGHTWAGQAWK